MNDTPITHRLWTVTQIAEAAGYAPQAVRKAIKEGRIKNAVKVGTMWVVPEADAGLYILDQYGKVT